MLRAVKLRLKRIFPFLPFVIKDEDDSNENGEDSSATDKETKERGLCKLSINVNGKLNEVTQIKTVKNGYEFRKLLESYKNSDGVQSMTLRNTPDVEYIPAAIGKFSSLTVLNLRNNQIVEMPWSIIYLNNLEVLDLSHNSLTEIPQIIGYLASLRELYLQSNNLGYLPTGIVKLSKLEILKAENNMKIHSPPKSICEQGKDAIFKELMRRTGRVNVLAGATPWYRPDWARGNIDANQRSAVDTLMKIAIDCILECQVDYLSPHNVPPRLKNFLQTTEDTRARQIQISACNVCKGYFSTELLFKNHYCKPPVV